MKFFATYKEAKRYQQEQRRKGKRLDVWDLKRTHPRRKKTRFLVGTRFDWLSI
jgi:hypothetical protein